MKQGKYSEELFTDDYIMKIISLIFDQGPSFVKPYIYQSHLW